MKVDAVRGTQIDLFKEKCIFMFRQLKSDILHANMIWEICTIILVGNT